jgi:ATP-dependent Clp protease ATP-binding subunit ClpC
MNGYNFTDRVRKVLALAREEAARLGHPYVGTEHELLGLVAEGEGVAATALVNLHAPLDAIRQRLESSLKRSRVIETASDLPYTSRAKKSLELAMAEARELNHAYVGTEHLLLGLIREEKGIAAQVLVSFGVTLDAARDEVVRILGEKPDLGDRFGSQHRQPPGLRASMRGPSRIGPGRVSTVLVESRNVAARFGARRLSATHAAIALLAHGEGTACAALERLGCNLDELARALEPSTNPAGSAVSSAMIPIAPDLERALETALREQQEQREPTLGTHHLLLAIMETCPEVAAPFEARGVTRERFRVQAERLVG